MKRLKEKVAYLQGLAEGLHISEDSKEGKVLASIIDVLAEMSEAISDLGKNQEELEEYVECIDQDLAGIEEDFYEEDVDDEDEEEYYEVECPECGETVMFEDSLVEDEETDLICPNCGKVIAAEDDEVTLTPGGGEPKAAR